MEFKDYKNLRSHIIAYESINKGFCIINYTKYRNNNVYMDTVNIEMTDAVYIYLMEPQWAWLQI